ncbi:MAG: hypothetical protein Q8Q09_21965 [Deltaproteobacteria bacterium]|nr:hypothetical protein [Deltaproteobacteria bacterium]
MKRQLQRVVAALSLTVVASSAACAGPLAVTAATSRENRIRFAYQQIGTPNSGLINCDANAGGDLENCQYQRVVFVEQKQGVAR